jgi:flagellar P-ring protein precursor FlgI
MGGTLLFTTLNGIDGTTHATAQGAVSVTGFEAAGQAETVTQGVPTVGRISNGAIVSRPMPSEPQQAELSLSLRNPDYATAVRVADAINAYSRKRFSRDIAREQNARSVLVARPRDIGAARLMAEIGALSVQPDTPARVVVDSRTGTVVIGQDVRISTVAVTHGTLTVRVTEAPTVSQPAPRSNGQTKVVPSTAIDAEQQGGPVAIVEGANLRSLVAGLNKIGLKPSGIIAILQAIKTAGALQADLVFQ